MSSQSIVTVYPMPEGMRSAEDYRVFINEQEVPVYSTRSRDGQSLFASFDCTADVSVRILARAPVRFVDVRPMSSRVATQVTEDEVRLTMAPGMKLVVEVNGRMARALHLFANPVETLIPRRTAPHVRYFGPGIHYAGDIDIQSGQTVYIAGGAYVYGRITAEDSVDVTVRGRGILDGSGMPSFRGNRHVFEASRCQRVRVEGVTLTQGVSWMCVLRSSRGVGIKNVKIFNAGGGGTDGIDLCNCEDVVVSDCYIRDCDDNICIKGLPTGDGSVRGILVEDCIVWSDGCRSLRVGVETQCEEIRDVTFRSIDIIHHRDISHPVLTVDSGDRADVRDIVFEDIRVEDNAGGVPLFDVWLGDSWYSGIHTGDARKGSIRRISFKGVDLLGGTFPRDTVIWADERLLGIEGLDDHHPVEDIAFENIHILGRHVDCAADANVHIKRFAAGVKFLSTTDCPVASLVYGPHRAYGPGERISFDASGSRAPEGSDIATYSWNLGDGTMATGACLEHKYNSLGHKLVTLTVEDETGRSAEASVCIPVIELVPARVPIALVRDLLYESYKGYHTLHGPRVLDRAIVYRSGVVEGFNVHTVDVQQYIAIRYTGYLLVEVSGVYGFHVDCDESAVLCIDTVEVANARWLIGTATDHGWIGLESGYHQVELVYCQKSRPIKRLLVEWEGPGFDRRVIPVHLLYHEKTV